MKIWNKGAITIMKIWNKGVIKKNCVKAQNYKTKNKSRIKLWMKQCL